MLKSYAILIALLLRSLLTGYQTSASGFDPEAVHGIEMAVDDAKAHLK